MHHMGRVLVVQNNLQILVWNVSWPSGRSTRKRLEDFHKESERNGDRLCRVVLQGLPGDLGAEALRSAQVVSELFHRFCVPRRKFALRQNFASL